MRKNIRADDAKNENGKHVLRNEINFLRDLFSPLTYDYTIHIITEYSFRLEFKKNII